MPFVIESQSDLTRSARVVVATTQDWPRWNVISSMSIIWAIFQVVIIRFKHLSRLINVADDKRVPNPVNEFIWRENDVVLAMNCWVINVNDDLLRNCIVTQLYFAVLRVLLIDWFCLLPCISVVLAIVYPIFIWALRTEMMLCTCLLNARHRNNLRLQRILKDVMNQKSVDINCQEVEPVVFAEVARVSFARLLCAKARFLVCLAKSLIYDRCDLEDRVFSFGDFLALLRVQHHLDRHRLCHISHVDFDE